MRNGARLHGRNSWVTKFFVYAALLLVPVDTARSAAVKEEDPAKTGPQARRFQDITSVAIEINVAPELSAYHRKGKVGWNKACERLTQVFSAGGGLWESGPAGSVTCMISGKVSASTGKSAPGDFKITIDIRRSDDTVQLGIALPGLDSKKSPLTVSTFRIPLTEWTPQFLADQEFASLVAYRLLDGGPLLGRLDKSRLSSKNDELRVSEYKYQEFRTRKFDSIDPLPNLSLYRLEQDQSSGRMFATHLGNAKLIKTEKVKVKTGKGASARTGFVVTARYSVDKKFTANSDGSGLLWIHSGEGPGSRDPKLASAVNEAHDRLTSAARSGLLDNLFSKGYESISDLLFQTAASGYVGLRYGRQLLTGNQLLEGAKMYGLLVEVRSGPLNGLKFYYDSFPKVSHESAGNTTTLQWSRLVLGKSFSFAFPFVINRIEVTPKLGRYFLSTIQPVEVDSDGTVLSTQKFEIRNQPSFSMEISAERAARLYTARIWYAIDRGIPFLPLIGTSAVSAERAGADLFLNSGLKSEVFGSEYSLNILAFGLYENLTIEDLKLEDLQPGEVAVSAIQLRSAYAGLGLVINW